MFRTPVLYDEIILYEQMFVNRFYKNNRTYFLNICLPFERCYDKIQIYLTSRLF